MSVSVRSRPRLSEAHLGIALGLLAAVMWGSNLTMNRAGGAAGLTADDVTFLRYASAGLVMLPYLASHDLRHLGGIGWVRGIALTVILGPLFMYLAVGGYAFAPLAHGAVFQPSGLIMTGTVLGVLVLGERLRGTQIVGVVIILTGLAVVTGPDLLTTRADAWRGDLLFIGAGSLWGLFTVLVKRWGLPPLAATATVSVLSGVLFTPWFVATDTFARIAAAPLSAVLGQILVQGVLSGVVATIAFVRAAQLIGASRVSVFPALVPVVAILLGIPVVGEWPTPLQVSGIVIVVIGLMTAIGAFHLRRGGAGRSTAPRAVPSDARCR